jgi:CRP/FNR family transcriptional regulator, cyclic AMP receptor protein
MRVPAAGTAGGRTQSHHAGPLEGNLMPEPEPFRLPLLEADPDLSGNLGGDRYREALRRLTVAVLPLRRGPWSPSRTGVAGGEPPFGMLVLEGLLVREATVGDHPCAELLGPGDLLRNGADAEADQLLPRAVEWTVLAPARVAMIDQDLVQSAVPFPEVLASLIDRATRRADRLIVLQAITHLTRVDDRLLALFWYLAERWGRVVPEGVALSLRLPHRTLAGMVGARRPSVTTALGQLLSRGNVERREDGTWLLRGRPPEPRHIGRTADPQVSYLPASAR